MRSGGSLQAIGCRAQHLIDCLREGLLHALEGQCSHGLEALPVLRPRSVADQVPQPIRCARVLAASAPDHRGTVHEQHQPLVRHAHLRGGEAELVEQSELEKRQLSGVRRGVEARGPLEQRGVLSAEIS